LQDGVKREPCMFTTDGHHDRSLHLHNDDGGWPMEDVSICRSSSSYGE
jgi:hypothetical protein